MIPYKPPHVLYSVRWYLLALYCIVSCNQSLIWITFSPIADKSKTYFNVTNETINLWLAWVRLYAFLLIHNCRAQSFTYRLFSSPPGC
jgi:hypothetical protein